MHSWIVFSNNTKHNYNRKIMINLSIMLEYRQIVIGLAVIALFIASNQIHFANAELHPGNSYVIYEKGNDLQNTPYTLDLQILLVGSDTPDKIPISIIEGLIVYDDKYFVTSQNWKGVIMKSDGLMLLSGDAIGANGDKISVSLLGKQINNTKHDAMYRLAGNIKYANQRTGFLDIIEIVNTRLLTSEKISKEMPHVIINQNKDLKKLVPPPKKADPITLITKHYDRFYLQYPYSFTSKVYYSKDNPHDNFDQKGGEVNGVHITADIINQNGDVVKSFDGLTSKFGYFSDSFLPPDNFVIGTYAVIVTAEKDGQSDIDELVFHIFKRPIGGKTAPMTTKNVPPEPVPEATPEPVPEATPEPVPEATPEPVPETIPPTISISSPIGSSTLRSSSFIVFGTAAGTNLASVLVTVDGVTKIVTGVNDWSVNSGVLSDGSHTVIATVTDGIGKTSSSIINVITDATAPSGTITSLSDGTSVSVPTLKISGTAYDPISGIKKVEVKIDSGAFQIATGTTAWTFNTDSLSDGTHTVQIRVTDNAGNVFTGLAITFTVNTAPTGLTAIALDENKISLVWTSPLMETGSITGYKIERESPIGGGWHIIISNTGNAVPTYTDTGLTAGTVYNYRVYTIYSDHTSASSNTASAKTSILALSLK